MEQRELVTVMFTDIVGYSKTMSINETHALELLDRHDQILEESLANFGGQTLKRMGDAILAKFPSATNALNCAIDMQTRLKVYNSDKTTNDRIAIRIGIHLGDVVIRNQDLFGDGVNVAARLEPLAEPGGICISQAVYQAIGSHTDIEPQLAGEIELKNILQKHVIYKIASLYPFTESLDESTPFASQVGATLSFKIDRIEQLDPPNRKFIPTLFLMLSVGFLSGLLGVLLINLFGGIHADIQPDHLIDTPAMILALNDRKTPELEVLWYGLDKPVRELIAGYVSNNVNEAEALPYVRHKLRRNLVSLIRSDVFILGPKGNVQWRNEIIELFKEHAASDDPRQVNRAVLDLLFEKELQRWMQPGGISDFIERMDEYSQHDDSFFFFGPILIAITIGAFLWSAYMATLGTLNISFKDIRNVDEALDYLIREMGFKPPIRENDVLVFKATLLTILLYNVLKLRVKIDGNQVLLTAPLPMIRRLKKRLLSLSNSTESQI